MASPELLELWKKVTADLQRARSTLPSDAAGNAVLQEYEEFLNHNELELSCDMLEAYAQDHPVSRSFWLALRDAADKMNLRKRANAYEGRAAR
jgi:hypothetical protein